MLPNLTARFRGDQDRRSRVGCQEFEEDTERNLVVSERTWTLTLQGVQGQAALPKTFQFASAKVPIQEMVYQRYQDADLQAVEQVIPLEKTYATKGANWFLWSLGLAGSGLLITGAALALKPRPAKPQADSTLPEHLDPFVQGNAGRRDHEAGGRLAVQLQQVEIQILKGHL